MYQWWVFVHLAGVFGFLLAHGVSVGVALRLRKERDPDRINALLQLSSSSIKAFYASLVVLVGAGTVAGFLGHWWSQGWIWTAIAVLVVATLAMRAVASPYYRRVGLVARALAGGTEAVTEDQFTHILRSSRPWTVAGIGFAALVAILYLMVYKPSLGFGGGGTPTATCAPAGTALAVSAQGNRFGTDCLAAPAGQPFIIEFDNRDGGVPHNVAVYTDSSASTALFRGEIVTGTTTTTYRVGALGAGVYYFRCDVHPFMNGSFVVTGPGSPGTAGTSP